ncbi:bifunctional aldolase/short-chain dehydrogenase [Sulfidibacter corallicola]|uniref:Bifunctional aldolase/short-chain dehydrogenase n=1 Tax=Sulfidibacter corallicola TaxID=2818388 RepID=A0A8A4TSF6_SULCO|nr:bifunctional aldolase/short-chain dehydrogenase [Sulfidibacter corallicola]QTD52896.1 bifunctional aldolase/short-chain dehydrogenase [Sulfidibacter corallicola]
MGTEHVWNEADAASYLDRYAGVSRDLALRVYTSRLLGRNPALVLHGGGNTSVKTHLRDELGRDVEVLCVKGSGWDLAHIEPPGFPAVILDPIRDFRQLDDMSDEAMVNGVRRFLLDTGAPNPSVETLLHAFLPHKFVDHTHADAILALADQPDAEALCRRVFGGRMGIVPYIMPGFQLAKAAAEVYERDPEVEGLILINHGIFTFADDARTAFERMLEMVALAEQWQRGHAETPEVGSASPKHDFLADGDVSRHLARLRGLLVNHPRGIGAQVLRVRRTPRIEAFLMRPDLTEVATRGPATPDHVIRTKQKPLVLARPEATDHEGFASQVVDELARYVSDYDHYFQTWMSQKQVEKTQLHPLPIVFLIPGIGLVTAGKTVAAAEIAADIWEHTIDVILAAESIGRYTPLPDGDIFDMEYWSLEQAKLGKKKPKPLAGRVALVTGACGGIGRGIAEAFAAEGANLVVTDMDAEALALEARRLADRFGVAVESRAGDLTDPSFSASLITAAGCAFGGLDAVLSNAGRAFTGPIDKTTDTLRTSLEINLLSHQYLAAAAVEMMVPQALGGCLLFNASKSAFNPGPGFGAYSVAKAGLIALMKQYAVEFADSGIRAMAINADRIRTNLFDADLVAERARQRGLEPDQYFRANLLGREVSAEDVGRAFLRLYLSEKTTAAVFTVDGGNIAASPR